jgi:hypothetical protein
MADIRITGTGIIGTLAKGFFEGTANQTKTFATTMVGIYIRNDNATGGNPLTVALNNGEIFKVLANEDFHAYVDPFTQVVITANGPYRGYGMV